tara:strand:+ start:1437 stop:2543 length:1107 start_codon:yes stop_codon:yes gene_type:complete
MAQDAGLGTISGLLAILNAQNNRQQRIAIQQEKEKNDKQINITNSFDELIDNISTPQDIQGAIQVSNSLNPIIKDNPEAIINKLGSDSKLNTTTSDYMNYKQQIDNAYDKYNYVKSLETKDIESWTLKDIMNEQDFVDDFLSSMYEDPIDMKTPVRFAGHYISKGIKSKNDSPLKDISIINEMKDYKDIINTAISALTTGNIITEEEAFYVLAGEKQKLLDRMKEVKANTKNNVKSYRSSLNSIKKYRKQLDIAIAKQELKGSNKFNAANIPMDLILSEYDIDKDSEWFKDKDGNPMDFDNYAEEKLSQYEDMTIQDVLDMWSSEEENLYFSMQEELKKYYHWTGDEMVIEGAKERAFERAIQEYKNK